MTKSLLLVTVEAPVGKMLGDQLAAQDVAVAAAASLDDACGRLAGQEWHLVLLDAQGVASPLAAACRALRDLSPYCPILVLGAGPAEEAALRAAGANGVLAKPFRLGALLQRIAELLRASPAGLRIGAFSLDPVGRCLTDAKGRAIRLTEKETAILLHLHRAGGQPVPREILLGEVWGYSSEASTHTVETHIYRLRRKLMGDDEAGGLLATEEGGYRLAL